MTAAWDAVHRRPLVGPLHPAGFSARVISFLGGPGVTLAPTQAAQGLLSEGDVKASLSTTHPAILPPKLGESHREPISEQVAEPKGQPGFLRGTDVCGLCGHRLGVESCLFLLPRKLGTHRFFCLNLSFIPNSTQESSGARKHSPWDPPQPPAAPARLVKRGVFPDSLPACW